MTEFYIGERASGKSTAAMRWLRGSVSRVLVVPDAQQASLIKRLDEQFSSSHRVPRALQPSFYERVVPYASLSSGSLRGMQRVELAVDNLDMLLAQLFHHPVGLVTATGEQYSGPSPQLHNYAEGI